MYPCLPEWPLAGVDTEGSVCWYRTGVEVNLLLPYLLLPESPAKAIRRGLYPFTSHLSWHGYQELDNLNHECPFASHQQKYGKYVIPISNNNKRAIFENWRGRAIRAVILKSHKWPKNMPPKIHLPGPRMPTGNPIRHDGKMRSQNSPSSALESDMLVTKGGNQS
jgi:hypothetical protein